MTAPTASFGVDPYWISLKVEIESGCKVSARVDPKTDGLKALDISCKKKISVPKSKLLSEYRVDLSMLRVSVSPSLLEVDNESGGIVPTGHYIKVKIPLAPKDDAGQSGSVVFVFTENNLLESFVEEP